MEVAYPPYLPVPARAEIPKGKRDHSIYGKGPKGIVVNEPEDQGKMGTVNATLR
jgi:hypothetical protein